MRLSTKGHEKARRADFVSGHETIARPLRKEQRKVRIHSITSFESLTMDTRANQSIQEIWSEIARVPYENTAIRLAPRLFRRQLGLTGTVLFSHQPVDQHHNLKSMADIVLGIHGISIDEVEDLLETDMVFRSKGSTGDVYVVAESSITVQPSDVARAKRRAETLHRVVSHTAPETAVVAVVIGKTISQEAQALLDDPAGEAAKVTFLVANNESPDS